MSDQLPMFGHASSKDTPSATSSPESASGPTRSGSRAGLTIAKSGPEAAPANPSARPAKAKRSTTKGIFGQSSFVSSKHDDLSFALASRLRRSTDLLGSTLFSLTWTVRVTPAGRSISALRASEPRTEGSVFIGWPTTRATDAEKNVRTIQGSAREMERKGGPQDLMQAASLTAWGTPAARDWKSGDASQDTLDKNACPLNELAMLAGWKTPCVPNGGRISGNETDIGKHRDGTKAQVSPESEARLSGWTTPQAHDTTGRSLGQKEIHGTLHGCACLVSEARLGAWATPKVASGDYQYSGPDHEKILNLQGQAQLTAFGETPIGYLLGPNGWEIVPALGQLNASHSRWLMGLPPTWDQAAIAAFRLLKAQKRELRGSADTETA